MVYIKTIDREWHPIMVEMPPTSTKVELMQNDGTIITAEITVDMAGFYIYLNPGWGSMSDYSHWRFIEGKDRPYLNTGAEQ